MLLRWELSEFMSFTADGFMQTKTVREAKRRICRKAAVKVQVLTDKNFL